MYLGMLYKCILRIQDLKKLTNASQKQKVAVTKDSDFIKN